MVTQAQNRMNKVVSFKPEYGTYQPDDGGKVLDVCPFCAAAPHLEQDQDETWYVACIKKQTVNPLSVVFCTVGLQTP